MWKLYAIHINEWYSHFNSSHAQFIAWFGSETCTDSMQYQSLVETEEN